MSVIVGGARTGIGRLLGSLKDFSATDLGGIAIKSALEKSKLSINIKQTISIAIFIFAACHILSIL